MSRKLEHRRYEEIKSLGADLIEDYELVYPLEPLEVAATLGVHVVIHIDWLPLMTQVCRTVDGCTEQVDSRLGQKFQVHTNGAMHPLRQRFTLAHELSHVWLEHLRSDAPVPDEQAEGEANFLASYLLAPDALILAWVPDLTISGIAQVFRISDEAAQLSHSRVMRAQNMNAIGRPHDLRILASATRRTVTPATTVRALLGLA